ncbi:1-aminocyclopropane-1-carboxylate deaminase/D-cysteine desulfhydrase [Pseudochryseolinea flava]|uniref:1-aminocyclopropane-1-carboxylate deaminase/D-cysteine desulfhydrase n=1 Tax=Pseudochryseolinea flava TaxID=2059302 RepID=A0A364YC28_9BACT|nr:1-aminocyclopropane-1-carboxylate deaminase/D-cysteine desulfhydrase [Pseudochryseolinea flava]
MQYNEPPLQEISLPVLQEAAVRLLVLREDLNHPEIAGNKWWKLKYNLALALEQSHDTLLTFGGAYSNHIVATAAVANENNLKSIGIIRGEETLPLNDALTFACSKGMRLHYVSREDYRHKTELKFIDSLREQFGNFYLIPEGGTNDAAVRGTEEWGRKISRIDFDYLCLPIGTGGTTAGILAGLDGRKCVLSISVLKGGDFLKEEVDTLTKNNFQKVYGNWQLLTSYHHGGYAKTSEPLLSFITEMKNKHNLPLDVVYTGKLLWAVLEEVRLGRFERGSTILAVHTGGLGSYRSSVNRE